MKSKCRYILGFLVVLLLIAGGVMALGRLLDPESTSDSLNSIKAFHELEENSLDVIVYGTSHAWKGCDTRVFEDKYGLKAYNYGGNWQAINTTLLFLQDSFRTQSPKVVCIDTYVAQNVLKDINMEGQIYYTRAISDFPGKREFLDTCFAGKKERYISYYVPLVMFHDNWTGIKKENFTGNHSRKYYKEMCGYDGSDNIEVTDLSLYKESVKRQFPSDALEVLDKIVEECEKKGTKIIFYTAPYAGIYDYAEAMEEYAVNHNCEYINMFECLDEIGIDVNSDFRDSQHMNDSGAYKIADYLGRFILGME